jgi:hypothetical protein
VGKQLTHRKPRYFFAVFGEPGAEKPRIDNGHYPHKGYISSLGTVPGDVILLYCTGFYAEHFMEAPGIGIVLDTSEEEVYYQYLPFKRPVDWLIIKESLKDYTNRLQNLSLKGNWLFEISSASFRNTLEGRQIDWR